MNTIKTGARDFFLYLFATGALYFSAGSIISLLFEYVNRWFPDASLYSYGYYGGGFSAGMRWAVSLLIIVFPVYVLAMRYLSKDIDRNPEKRELGIRKAMIYLTLFLAAIAIIVDLISLVYNFLGGELTVRFALKALAVLLVAGLVFWYYTFSLKREPGTKSMARKAFMWGTLAFVAVVVVGAFFVVGSPAQNRMLRMDAQRVNDLNSVQWQVINYWQTKQKLPTTLAETIDPISGYVLPKDPSTQEDYEYKSTGARSFELCATFETESLTSEDGKMFAHEYGYYQDTENWKHGAERTCFSRTIDPDRYPAFR